MDVVETREVGIGVVINAIEHRLPAGATILEAARALGVEADQRGVAIALGGVVVRRADWATTPLRDGDRVEVVRAAAGG